MKNKYNIVAGWGVFLGCSFYAAEEQFNDAYVLPIVAILHC
jgi:hypothetical protein